MATAYKNAQVAAPANSTSTYATLYNTTGSNTAVISTILFCNTSASPVNVRVGIMGSAGTPTVASGQFIAYDVTIAANDTLSWTGGFSVGNNQYIRVSADSTAMNFFASIAEITL